MDETCLLASPVAAEALHNFWLTCNAALCLQTRLVLTESFCGRRHAPYFGLMSPAPTFDHVELGTARIGAVAIMIAHLCEPPGVEPCHGPDTAHMCSAWRLLGGLGEVCV